MNSNPNKTLFQKFASWVSRLMGVEPQVHYFRRMENVEIEVNWISQTMTIAGDLVERANPDQAVWIRHLVRQKRKAGEIRHIDQL